MRPSDSANVPIPRIPPSASLRRRPHGIVRVNISGRIAGPPGTREGARDRHVQDGHDAAKLGMAPEYDDGYATCARTLTVASIRSPARVVKLR